MADLGRSQLQQVERRDSNLDGLTNVYSLAPSYMGYGGGHKSGALRDCITWGKGFQYLWGLPLCLTGNRLNGNIPDGIKGRQSRTEIDLSYSNFFEQSALPSCRDSLQELFLKNLVVPGNYPCQKSEYIKCEVNFSVILS
ncbi:hypothetical protein CK203_116308 [Vitis vinifera]|uniref:Uncharacterized protein n=1 Tax=Vitis vinifera TaxID=29760 RepID=A0A438CD66_VITVI|nr:hypothetical protein CK203_116308 [Vitis vinifera]